MADFDDRDWAQSGHSRRAKSASGQKRTFRTSTLRRNSHWHLAGIHLGLAIGSADPDVRLQR